MVFISSLKLITSLQSSCGILQCRRIPPGVLEAFSSSSSQLGQDPNAYSPILQDLMKGSCDCIGPPHPVSRLRPVVYHVPDSETPLQTSCRAAHADTQLWNQEYWLQHNTAFEKEKQAFITHKLTEKQSRLGNKRPSSEDGGDDGPPEQLVLTSDEMAEFYKLFLDKNYDRHMQYNWEWYKKNFANIKLAAKVWLESKFK